MLDLRKPTKLDGAIAKHQRRVAKRAAKAKAERKEKLEKVALILALRRAVFARDKGKCRVCLNPLKWEDGNPLKAAHMHHVIYRSAGGGNTTGNCVIVCARCHKAEHDSRIKLEGNADQRLTLTVYDVNYEVLDVRQV